MINEQRDFYPFWVRLSDTQREVYNELLAGINKASPSIPITTRCVAEDVFEAVTAIINDHPEIFWCTGSSRVNIRNGYVISAEVEYNPYAKNLSFHKIQLQSAVLSYLRETRGQTVINQIRTIHDVMSKRISYIHGTGDQTSYSALVEQKTVCAGYTRGFQLLMQKLAVPCYYCRGLARGKNDKEWDKHAWNILKLGDDFYNMDLTWDDQYNSSADYIGYSYFNCTDAEIADTHRRDPKYTWLPKCRGTRFSFQNSFGVNAELMRVLQDGVTCKTVINKKDDFFKLFIPELRHHTTIEFSFPSESASIYDCLTDWVSDAVRDVYGQRAGWNLSRQRTNYNNGWYRMSVSLKVNL